MNRDGIITGRSAGAGIANCERCGIRCQVHGPGNQDARLLRLSTEARGYCVNCAVAEWFQKQDMLMDLLSRPRCQTCGGHPDAKLYGERKCTCAVPKVHTAQDMLRLPHVRELFAQILATGHADVDPAQIDWDEVISNWHLPFGKPKRKKSRKP